MDDERYERAKRVIDALLRGDKAAAMAECDAMRPEGMARIKAAIEAARVAAGNDNI